MKMELIEIDKNDYGFYITRNELLKQHKLNQNEFWNKLQSLTNTLTSEHCFYISEYWSSQFFRDNFMQIVNKTTTKGIKIGVYESWCNNDYDFKVIIIKK